jgi:hypothetical protein
VAATMRAISSPADVRTRRGAGHGGGNAHSKTVECQDDIIG